MIRALAVFDLDGTLLRGDTVCEVLAKPIGRLEEIKQFQCLTSEPEIIAGRIQMAAWYKEHSIADLKGFMKNVHWAPGAHEAIRELHKAGIIVGIASMTWKFAVAWCAEQLGVRDWLGTDIRPNGDILHVFGRHKAQWVQNLATSYGVPPNRIAAVGDSARDLEMLRIAELRFLVGSKSLTAVKKIIHYPDTDLRTVARYIIKKWVA